MSGRVFLDSNVVLYAIGDPSPWRDSCAALVEQVASGRVEAHVSIEALQEILFHRIRRVDRREALSDTDLVAGSVTVHPFDAGIWESSRHLVATTSIRGRDAVHAATALAHGFDEIVTVDAKFVAVPGLTPVRP